MKTKLLLSILLLSALLQSNAQNVLPAMKPRPADYEYLSAPDSLGIRHQLLMPSTTNKNVLAAQNLPCPIIFIHGLNSNDLIWGNTSDTNLMYNFFQSQNLTFGGRFDFDLNYDGDNSYANKNIYPTTGADIAQWATTPTIGDYYFVNFDTGSDGSFHPLLINSANVLSNQSAIAKQGVALKRVIERVMSLTQRDKVVLMGHSMGGLASREYLQNPENWKDPYINHHVAKLVTTGTPHGGSNVSGSIFGTILTGIDNKSEAVRDLRTSYYYSPNAPGVFLFGGVESNYIMNDMAFANFYNLDVNCNGDGVTGENIQGLNQKSIPNNLDYSCIIGTVTGSDSDGIVNNYSADLGNFYSTLPINKFYYTAPASLEIHTDLPKQIYQNMQGLDEPNEYSLSYGIDLNKTYKGFITQQPVNGWSYDYDDYKFITTGSGNLNLTISNTFTDNIVVSVYNMNMQLQGSSYTIPNGNWLITIPLSAGQYYLEIYATPTTTSYLYPYTFNMTYTLSSDNFDKDNSIKLFPNPTSSKVFFDNSNSNFKEVSIYNYLGQEVTKTSFQATSNNQEIDMSALATGIYVLKFSDGDKSKSIKVVKQ